MNAFFTDQVISFMAGIEQDGASALLVGFTLGVIFFVFAGILIWRRRYQFFDRDPDVDNDVSVVRHNREEEIILVWSGMTIVLLFILYQVWSA